MCILARGVLGVAGMLMIVPASRICFSTHNAYLACQRGSAGAQARRTSLARTAHADAVSTQTNASIPIVRRICGGYALGDGGNGTGVMCGAAAGAGYGITELVLSCCDTGSAAAVLWLLLLPLLPFPGGQAGWVFGKSLASIWARRKLYPLMNV